MSEPPPRAKPGQILSMTLTYLPTLLSLVVQMALLILVFRYWGLLDKAEARLNVSDATKTATKEASDAIQKAVRDETERAIVAMNVAIKDAEGNAIADAQKVLNGLIAELKTAQPTYKIQIQGPSPSQPAQANAPHPETSGGRGENAAALDGETANVPHVDPNLPANLQRRDERNKPANTTNTRSNSGNNTGSPKP